MWWTSNYIVFSIISIQFNQHKCPMLSCKAGTYKGCHDEGFLVLLWNTYSRLLSKGLLHPDYVVGEKVFQNTPYSEIPMQDFGWQMMDSTQYRVDGWEETGKKLQELWTTEPRRGTRDNQTRYQMQARSQDLLMWGLWDQKMYRFWKPT